MSWQIPPEDEPGFREELAAVGNCLKGLWRFWPVYLFVLAAVLIFHGRCK